MIVLDTENKLITLHTQNTTYQMKVWDYNILLHTYYGARISGGDLSYLLRRSDRGFSPNPNEAGSDRTFSLDTFPQEYSTCGVGDFRLPSIELELPSGSRTADLRYVDSEVRRGKYALEGLPAFHGGGDEWETLSVTLTDAAAQVDVELLYGVLEKYDLITRSVRVVNRGEHAVRLCRCASLCLDFARADLDMITFNGAHVMERCPSRVPLHPGIQSAESVRGASSHQHNPFVILCDRNTDEDHGLSYGVMLLYSGNFQAAAELDQFENSRLVMGINPYQFGWV
ncbi:MAG: alpha-galactosidase, partial [Oscillospiraceae bacterium]|nr:alpha-galactosidase [Oscillospiraceae bacterium]